MKLVNICKIVGPIMLIFALLVQSMAANPENLVVGVGGPLSSSNASVRATHLFNPAKPC